MKIGILTFHAPCNFGANLQAYSSTRYFERLGHEVMVLNYIRNADEKYKETVQQVQYDEHHSFVNANLPLTAALHTAEQVKAEIKNQAFDLVIIGADAVWRTPKSNDDLIFFGSWLVDESLRIPTASLSAAHMGDGFGNLSSEHKNVITEALSRFKIISTRDTWTRDKINHDIFNSDRVRIVNPDPVIWLSDFMTDRIANFPSEIHKGNYILMSLPKDWIKHHTDKRVKWFERFKSIVNEYGYKLVELPIPEGSSGAKFDYTIPYPLNPIDWFSWIRDAKAFCGVRFHAIVSCISAGTPFFSIDSYGNPSRIISIANRLGAYRIARSFDHRSKIRNLLKNSPFENYRVHGEIANISPSKLYKRLCNTDSKRILEFRDKLRAQFNTTVSMILD